MYCSSCGATVPRELSYCNHCGARLVGAKDEAFSGTAGFTPDSLIWAIVGVFVCGLGSIIGLIAVMKNYGLNDGLMNAAVVSIFLLMLVIEAVFIGLLMGKSRGKEKKQSGRLKEKATKELEPAQPRALPEPLTSVTEHTTRAFEPIYRERKTD